MATKCRAAHPKSSLLCPCGAEKTSLVRGRQLRQLRQHLRHLRDVPQLLQVLRLEDVDHAVAPDLPDDGVDAVEDGVGPPVVLDGVHGDGVEDDAGHDPGEDGAVLDEGVVVSAGLLVDDCHDPLQHCVLQLEISLGEEDGECLAVAALWE